VRSEVDAADAPRGASFDRARAAVVDEMQPRGVERARAHRAAVAAALAMTRARGSEVVIVPRRHVGIVLAAVGRSQRSIAAAAVPPLLSLRATPRARPLSLRRTARSLHANARATPRMSGKMRWGDSADLDGSDDDFDVALPASQARALRRAARRSFARTRSRAAVHPSRLPSLMNRALRRLSLLRARANHPPSVHRCSDPTRTA
jgi:hypothetical protein